MSKGKGPKGSFSLRSADATEGGGVDGALATVEVFTFEDGFTYGGRHGDNPKVCIKTSYRIDGFDKPWTDNWVVGDESKYELVNDGDGVRSLGKNGGLNKKSGAYFLFSHLEEAIEKSGLDYDEVLPVIEGEGVQDISGIQGRRVRLAMVPFTNMQGDTKDKAVIAEFVEEEQPVKGKAASKPNGKAAAASSDVEEKAESWVGELLAAGKPVKKFEVVTKLMQAHRSDPDIKSVLNLANGPWLASDERPWEFDTKKGTLTEGPPF